MKKGGSETARELFKPLSIITDILSNYTRELVNHYSEEESIS